MPQLDTLIIAPLIISLIFVLTFGYYLTFKLMIKTLKTLKFRTKLKKLKNPCDVFIKLKDITYFESDKKKK
jgi:hypothetical protein